MGQRSSDVTGIALESKLKSILFGGTREDSTVFHWNASRLRRMMMMITRLYL